MLFEHLGWNAHFQSLFAELENRDALTPARIARQDRESYVVYTAERAIRATVRGIFRHRAGSPADYPVVGDWVAVQPHAENGHLGRGEATGTIHAVLQRTSAIARKAAGDGMDEQMLAANVDALLICCGLDGDFNPRRIERFLALAYGCGVAPVVLLTKADLCDDADGRVAEVESSAIGVPVIAVSADGRGVDLVRTHVPVGRTAALVGSSGVGKSTLINVLLGRDAMQTGAVRADDSRGRHTTTHRQLFLVPDGGVIIDTPGLRELQLSGGTSDVGAAFAEIEQLALRCRFRDCGHQHEPGCRVRAAMEDGTLAPARVASYHKQQREVRYYETRDDPAAVAAQRDRWKAVHKSARAWMKKKYGG